MSDKIKSKDLSYDSSLPPFLQRLHEQKAGRGDTDRHERPIARARRAKDPNDDDDGPTVVDDSGETISKAQLELLTTGTTDAIQDTPNVKGELDPGTGPKASGALPDNSSGARRTEQTITDGTAQKKRKAAKVVGDDDETDDHQQATTAKKVAKKVKKKTKPVKLAFDDDAEGNE